MKTKVVTVLGATLWIAGAVVGAWTLCAAGSVGGLVAVFIAAAVAAFVAIAMVCESTSGGRADFEFLVVPLGMSGLICLVMTIAAVGSTGGANVTGVGSIALSLMGAAMVAFGMSRR